VFVDPADQASAIPLFDEASAAVFACLCRLTDGDARRAQELLVESYVTASSGTDVARVVTDLVDVARRLFLAADRSPAQVERVVADMHFVDHRPVADIAAVVDQSPDLVSVIVDSLSEPGNADLRRSEIWFDDAKRADARLAIADRLPGADSDARLARQSRRRVGLIAAVAAVAALIALVVWVRNGDDIGDAASSPTTLPITLPSTTAAPTSTSAPTTTSTEVDSTTDLSTSFTVPSDASDTSTPENDPTGFILDPPLPGFVGFGAASELINGGDDSAFPLSIWATSDAGTAAGRWLAVGMDEEDLSAGLYSTLVNERREIAGHPALLSTTALGAKQLLVPLGDGRQIDVYWSGIDTDTVADLVAGTTIGADNMPMFAPDATEALNGLDLVASISTARPGVAWWTWFGDGQTVQYGNPDSGAFIGILTAPQRPNDLRVAALLASNSNATASEVVPIEGRNVVIVTIAYDDVHERRFAVWHVGADTVAIIGELSMEDIVLAVRSSRLATADEWKTLADAVPPDFPFDEMPVETVPHIADIGSVTTTDKSSWTIRLSDDGLGRATASVEVDQRLPPPTSEGQLLPQGVNQLPLPIDPSNPLTTFETLHATILIAAFDGPTDATSMRVTLFRRTPVVVPVVAVPETALSGAAYVFSELVPYTVELLDASGAVLQTLTPA